MANLPDSRSDLSGWILKLVLMAMAMTAATLLLRDIYAIAVHASLDPIEGWNAYRADATVSGDALYPSGSALTVADYPPLSFYVVGAFSRLTGDAIVAGRLVSLVSFLAIVVGLMVLLRQLGARVLDSLFAGLAFALALLATSAYVATNEPQLLGHALQLEGLLLLLRPKPVTMAVALLFAASLFVKPGLVALPLAATVWLVSRDRAEGARLAGEVILFTLLGLAAVRMGLGVNLLQAVAAPRAFSFANLAIADFDFLSWACAAIAVLGWLTWRFRHDKWVRFTALYGAIALAVALFSSAGDGVNSNVFFDCALALALGGGLALSHFANNWSGVIALSFALPLTFYLWQNYADDNFFYSELVQRQSTQDIAFLATHPGPALCEDTALCYWAGKSPEADVFALSEGIKTGTARGRAMTRQLQQGYYQTVEFDSLRRFALGPDVLAALRARYRIQHEDDYGVFLVRR